MNEPVVKFRPLKRALVVRGTALSAVATLLCSAAWAFSYRSSIHAGWPVLVTPGPPGLFGSHEIALARGRIRWYSDEQRAVHPPFQVRNVGHPRVRAWWSTPPRDLESELMKSPHRAFLWLGFGFARGGRRDFRWDAYFVPIWLIVVLTAIAPAVSLRRHFTHGKRAARRLRNLCENCGYDLRGGNATCPECGTLAATRRGHLDDPPVMPHDHAA
jgi:hypothetical protein